MRTATEPAPHVRPAMNHRSARPTYPPDAVLMPTTNNMIRGRR